MRPLFGFLAFLLLAQPALAGHIWQWAESAEFPESLNNGDCSKYSIQDDERAYTVVRCHPAAGTGVFTLPIAFPDDAPNNWGVRFHAQTPSSATGSDCHWEVEFQARPDSGEIVSLGGLSTATWDATAMASDVRVISPLIDTAKEDGLDLTPLDVKAAAKCSGTTCRNTSVQAFVQFHTDSDRTICDFRMLEVVY